MYLFFTICALSSFFIFQKKVKNSTFKKYLSLSIFPVMLYCLAYGLRKGWGTDYQGYSNLFEGKSRLSIEDYEPLFQAIVIFLRQISDSSVIFFVVASAMTIFSYIYVLKNNRDILGLGLSLFYLFSAYQASNLIRYFMALSITYIGIDLALRKKWFSSIIILLVAVLIHAGISIFIVMILPFFKFKMFLNLKYNILLYIVTALVSIGSVQSLFGDIIYKGLTSLNFGGLQLIKYADRDIVNNYILGTAWGDVDKSIFYVIFNWLNGFLFIILGHRLIKQMPNINNIEFYYQIGVWGAIFGNIAVNTEILYRISISFTYLSSFVYAYIIKYNKRLSINPVIFVLFILSVVYMCIFSLKQIYRDFDVLYIWN